MQWLAALISCMLLSAPVLAREITPAERREEPFDASSPGLRRPVRALATSRRDSQTRENPVLEFRPADRRLRARPRRRAGVPGGSISSRAASAPGTVIVSDGYKRRIDFSIREDLGFIGIGWGTEWCVDRPRPPLRLRAPMQAGARLDPAPVACASRAPAFSVASPPAAHRSAGGAGRPGGAVRLLCPRPVLVARLLRERAAAGAGNATTGSGLGFVTHGLWPQNEQGYPSFCEPGGRFVPRPALDEANGLFPDENLARYQWRKHGTCTGEAPSGYFRAVRQARDLVRIPDGFNGSDSRSQVLPIEIERAFAQANPGLRPDMMAISCGRRIFQEIRICLDRDLRGFRPCPEVDRDGCRAARSVPAVSSASTDAPSMEEHRIDPK